MGSLNNNPSQAQAQIPVIDISPSNPSAPSQLLSAAQHFGFVFVANNSAGIDPDLIDRTFKLSEEFFALPETVKQAVSIASNKAGKNHGWLSQGVEKLNPGEGGQVRADVKEAFNMGLPNSNGQFEQPLPSLIQDNLQTIVSFQESCGDLCQRILEHFALGLGIEKNWFTSRHDRSKGPSGTIFRLLYYPARNDKIDEVDIRAGAHSDYGSITCLFQLPGQPGLEILTPGKTWSPVPVDPLNQGNPLPILLNIGDLLEDWTSGLLKSTKHRVVFPKEEHGDRYSIAYFFHPLDEARLEPVPSKLVEEHAKSHGKGRADGKVITARDHLMERLAATYTV